MDRPARPVEERWIPAANEPFGTYETVVHDPEDLAAVEVPEPAAEPRRSRQLAP